MLFLALHLDDLLDRNTIRDFPYPEHVLNSHVVASNQNTQRYCMHNCFLHTPIIVWHGDWLAVIGQTSKDKTPHVFLYLSFKRTFRRELWGSIFIENVETLPRLFLGHS